MPIDFIILPSYCAAYGTTSVSAKFNKASVHTNPSTMKKPQSSYMLFSNDQRNLIKQETPGLSIGEIAKITGLKWKALSTEDREV